MGPPVDAGAVRPPDLGRLPAGAPPQGSVRVRPALEPLVLRPTEAPPTDTGGMLGTGGAGSGVVGVVTVAVTVVPAGVVVVVVVVFA
jgi:hypothetical protein